jgi:GNAT superfamily N-acetyltransferase
MTHCSYSIRRATEDDIPAILHLAHLTLGWEQSPRAEQFFRWKHLENPYGESPMWVAVQRGDIVGFRAFVPWHLRAADGRTIKAARAVDTATHPDYQRRGIFRNLTLHALDELAEHGIELIFNTPNKKSLPGYLDMGLGAAIHRTNSKVTCARRSLVTANGRGRACRGWIHTCRCARKRGIGEKESMRDIHREVARIPSLEVRLCPPSLPILAIA